MKRLGRRNRKHPVPDPVVSLNHIRLKLSSAALWGRLLNPMPLSDLSNIMLDNCLEECYEQEWKNIDPAAQVPTAPSRIAPNRGATEISLRLPRS
jgi:hypothetical protein